MGQIKIRKARLADAAEIANVHINSWREAYEGLIDQSFLDDRPLHFKNRYELWKKVTVNESQTTLVAESDTHGIVGFINGTSGRDEKYNDFAEVWCLYLLQKYQGQSIGYKLLKKFFEVQYQLGFRKGYLWVLDKNPTINFYKRTGGEFLGETKSDVIGEQTVKELCFIWNKLKI